MPADRYDAERGLRNLLAIIHRDGGHYTAKFGFRKAVDDAHIVWARLQGVVQAARQLNDQLSAHKTENLRSLDEALKLLDDTRTE